MAQYSVSVDALANTQDVVSLDRILNEYLVSHWNEGVAEGHCCDVNHGEVEDKHAGAVGRDEVGKHVLIENKEAETRLEEDPVLLNPQRLILGELLV